MSIITKALAATISVLVLLTGVSVAEAETSTDLIEGLATIGTTIGDIEFVGAPIITSGDDGLYFTGYLNNSIKHVEVHKGKVEILTNYGTNYASDAVYDEATDTEGNRYVACFAHDGEDNDMGTVKFNPQGEIEWVRVFDSGGRDISHSICVDADGNVYTAGFTYLGKDDGVRIIKYDPQGQMAWMVIYDEEGYDKPGSISFDDEGNVQVRCLSDGQGLHTITYDPNGNRI